MSLTSRGTANVNDRTALLHKLEREAAAAIRFAGDWFASVFTVVVITGILLGLVRL